MNEHIVQVSAVFSSSKYCRIYARHVAVTTYITFGTHAFLRPKDFPVTENVHKCEINST